MEESETIPPTNLDPFTVWVQIRRFTDTLVNHQVWPVLYYTGRIQPISLDFCQPLYALHHLVSLLVLAFNPSYICIQFVLFPHFNLWCY